MLVRFLLAAILAGVLAGVFVTAVQAVRVTPLILKAETFENQSGEESAHSHEAEAKAHEHGGDEKAQAHHHDEEAWGPEDGFERTFYTMLTNILAGVAFSLILSAGILLTNSSITLQSGLLWGLCGFIAFVLAPNFGLSPELPGMAAAELQGRQAWWLATVSATSVALLIFAFKRQIIWMLAGLALILAPHIYGAPVPPAEESLVPAILAAEFAIATIVTSFLFWLFLGGVLGWLVEHKVIEKSSENAA